MASAIIPLTMACLLHAAQLQSVPPEILATILKVEGGRVGEVSKNTNGTVDLGPMQVNSGVWVKPVAKMHFEGDEEAAYATLRDNGCYNMHIAAWILRQAIEEADGDLAEGIGRYHSRTPHFKKRYQNTFKRRFVDLFVPKEERTALREAKPAPKAPASEKAED